MQKKDVTGDALLAKDADYVRGAVSRVYYAYPSAELPRFLVPLGDRAGLLFAIRTISPPLGAVVRTLALVPGVLMLVRTFFFTRIEVAP